MSFEILLNHQAEGIFRRRNDERWKEKYGETRLFGMKERWKNWTTGGEKDRWKGMKWSRKTGKRRCAKRKGWE